MMYERDCILTVRQGAHFLGARHMRFYTMNDDATVWHRSKLARSARTMRRVRVLACVSRKAAHPRLPERFYGTIVAVRIDE